MGWGTTRQYRGAGEQEWKFHDSDTGQEQALRQLTEKS
jgi:hypothetical protein